MVLQVLTGDSWAEAIANPIAGQIPYIQIYFGEKTIIRQRNLSTSDSLLQYRTLSYAQS